MSRTRREQSFTWLETLLKECHLSTCPLTSVSACVGKLQFISKQQHQNQLVLSHVRAASVVHEDGSVGGLPFPCSFFFLFFCLA